MKPSLLLYIHGFNSSPLSLKASLMKSYCETHRSDIRVLIPQIPCFPEPAKAMLIELVERYKDDFNIGLVGSSLGGYFSTWLNDIYGFRAVLVNPAVKPYELLQDFLGEQVNPYTQEHYVLKPEHVKTLRTLDVVNICAPESLWLLQQKEDEVLDYRQAVEKYAASKQTVESGGDHSFQQFERFPAEIIHFLEL